MELTINQAFQRALAAHKAGKVQEADRLYTAILKAQPKHPDANHNLGVLVVSVGKANEALPFLKTALEANPSVPQFWLSFIDALIKLDRIAEANAVLEQAKSKGAKGDSFDKLEQQLSEKSREQLAVFTHNVPSGKDQNNALNIATQLKEKGEFDPAIDLLMGEVSRSSEDVEMLVLLSHCYLMTDRMQEAKLYLHKAKEIAPDNASVGWNTARLKLKEQKPLKALSVVRDTSEKFPDDVEGMGVLGACLRVNGEIVESLNVLNRAINLNPYYAEALINRGLIRLNQGNKSAALSDLEKAHNLKPHIKQIWDLVIGLKMEAQEYSDAILLLKNMIAIDPDDEKRLAKLALCYQYLNDLDPAIKAYQKALDIKPDYYEAHNNMGLAFKDQGKLEKAVEAYKKAIDIKPDYFEAYNNMGIALNNQGKIGKAIEAYQKALDIKPDNAEAIENSRVLLIQLLPIIGSYGYYFESSEAHANSEIVLRPKYQIQNAIKAYIDGDFDQANSSNHKYKACDQHRLDELNSKDKVFCNAYSRFIGKLLEASQDVEPASENILYHLGESHCLSYAHRHVKVAGSNCRIEPRITFGAKAFHFSRQKHDAFKAITEAHFASLPKKSMVFLSYGEIDCRHGEGFIPAAAKHGKQLEELIDQTTRGYVKWFSDHNADQKHDLYFFNVPAPVYNKKLCADLNSKVATVVSLFNAALKKYALQHGFNIVDVFKFTAGKGGFSNGLFHVDSQHLGAKALLKIQRQLA